MEKVKRREQQEQIGKAKCIGEVIEKAGNKKVKERTQIGQIINKKYKKVRREEERK